MIQDNQSCSIPKLTLRDWLSAPITPSRVCYRISPRSETGDYRKWRWRRHSLKKVHADGRAVMPQSHHIPRGPVRAVPALFWTKIVRPRTGPVRTNFASPDVHIFIYLHYSLWICIAKIRPFTSLYIIIMLYIDFYKLHTTFKATLGKGFRHLGELW